ncbi:MAG TPA: protein kinase [Vicinamibacterales bacterium]|nr:protein kinase [Vicinamibacterales bacterium]
MPFPAGTRLGPYEIVAPIGAGGMGEVYRARDTRLDRTVAVKVLTGALSADPESRARFEQEARAIAALNDPRICTIHDVGRSGDLDFLVLEYLEGETLADRLQQPAALSIDEALGIAIQIGEGLHRAHRAGIAHRDLKPGNVMLVRRGGPSTPPAVKLLDFGLAARSAGPAAGSSPIEATIEIGDAVTRPRVATTTVSGTLPYMAPEQLQGREGDHRADIFAFGCVLYEMLAGRKAFDGANPLAVIAAVTNSEPPPIPALAAHPLLAHVLRRLLEKDPERRWQSIADATAELQWIRDNPAAAIETSGKTPVRRGTWRAPLGAGLLAAALLAAGALFAGRRGTPPEAPLLQFEIATEPTDDPSVALSPDGTRLAYVANRGRVPVLWVRELGALESRQLPGTERASMPFWSPDGRTVAFFADLKLKRIDPGAAAPLVIADAPNARGGTWSQDGHILFAYGIGANIKQVPSTGGALRDVTSPQVGPDHRWPHFLPDGRRFLFSSTLGTVESNGVYLGSLDASTVERVLASDGAARFAPPDTLLTIEQGALHAYRFDPDARSAQGEPTVVAQGFAGALAGGGFSMSTTGVLAYRAGTAQRRQLVWANRQGKVERRIGEPSMDFRASPELSADDQHVLLFLQQSGDNDVWLIELARNLARRLTDGRPADAHPMWDPDGAHVVFYTRRFGGGGPARLPLTGGSPQPLLAAGETGHVLSWTRDRQHLLLRRQTADRGGDLVAVRSDGRGPEVIIAASNHEETEGQFAPNGKWVAFVTHESGRPEVFVQPFPAARGRTQVSTAGGSQVRWAPDNREIYYVAPDGQLMAAAIDLSGGSALVSAPTPLFRIHLATGANVIGYKPQYAVSRDGRFLLNSAVESGGTPIVIAVNWRKAAGR